MADLPPLRALQVFEAVGRLGSVTRAAQELHVSPGAVSQQIKSLENTLETRLVERKGSGIVLTKVGTAFHKAVEKSFADLLKARVEIIDKHKSGALIISALPLFASRWLSSRMFAWQTSHPQINLHLEGSVTEPATAERPFDFRITYADKAHLFDSFVPLFTDGLCPVCSPALIENGPPLNTPADLLSYRLLTIDWSPFLSPPPSWEDWFHLVNVDGTHIPHFFVMSLSSLAIEAAIEGRGIVLAQRAMVEDELRSGRLIAPFPDVLKLPSPYILGWKKSVFGKAGAGAFHRWLVGLARKEDVAAPAPTAPDPI
ncbi:LysR substrate-binding domain-containing protein [Nitratireductor soli]|uniref:LysR substrate-binding domain-containing protein n=1 Tax=Nitratireductor soli TaxID=1670619 RepID=UPI000B158E48|nr:LysR substrate-binding domain-containing protein [Nitratireductor soli]